MKCCLNPDFKDMSFKRLAWNQNYEDSSLQPMITHLYCHKCKSHLYGEKDLEIIYSAREWDEFLNEGNTILEDDLCQLILI